MVVHLSQDLEVGLGQASNSAASGMSLKYVAFCSPLRLSDVPSSHDMEHGPRQDRRDRPRHFSALNVAGLCRRTP